MKFAREPKQLRPNQKYLVGRVLSSLEPQAWEFCGVFDREFDAIEACYDENCFYASIEINEKAPRETMEFPNAKFPKELHIT